MLPHLDAAYNLARWLLHDSQDAEDVVQDAYLKAFRHFSTYRGGPAKAWLLTIVRNTAYNFLGKKGRSENVNSLENDLEAIPSQEESPAVAMERASDVERVNDALRRLPVDYRDAIVLRELEGLSYKEIASITDVPIGTVMSRIARARDRMRVLLK